jgi:DNA repair protein RecO (recombination protein O)
LDTITGSQTISPFLALKSDLELSSLSLYAAELVDQFAAEHVGNYPLFRLLLETLNNLCQNENCELARHYFELHLLSEVGYRPQLQQCVACGREPTPVTNAFSASTGGVLCPNCSHGTSFTRSLSADALKVLRLLQSERYDIVRRLKINQALSLELDSVIRGYIQYLLEREIKSASFLDSLKELGPTFQ